MDPTCHSACAGGNGAGCVNPQQPPPKYATPEELARRALAKLKLPTPDPSTAPPKDKQGLVGLPVWVWLSAEQQHPLTARAEDGPIWAQVTAAPKQVLISPGDGSPTVTCPGFGTAYNPSVPASSQRTDCSFTYLRAGTYRTTVSVVWGATWAGTGGAGGVLPDLTMSTTFAVRIAEGQTVN